MYFSVSRDNVKIISKKLLCFVYTEPNTDDMFQILYVRKDRKIQLSRETVPYVGGKSWFSSKYWLPFRDVEPGGWHCSAPRRFTN